MHIPGIVLTSVSFPKASVKTRTPDISNVKYERFQLYIYAFLHQ
jgi:hypothetical protein